MSVTEILARGPQTRFWGAVRDIWSTSSLLASVDIHRKPYEENFTIKHASIVIKKNYKDMFFINVQPPGAVNLHDGVNSGTGALSDSVIKLVHSLKYLTIEVDMSEIIEFIAECSVINRYIEDIENGVELLRKVMNSGAIIDNRTYCVHEFIVMPPRVTLRNIVPALALIDSHAGRDDSPIIAAVKAAVRQVLTGLKIEPARAPIYGFGAACVRLSGTLCPEVLTSVLKSLQNGS